MVADIEFNYAQISLMNKFRSNLKLIRFRNRASHVIIKTQIVFLEMMQIIPVEKFFLNSRDRKAFSRAMRNNSFDDESLELVLFSRF